MRLILEYSVLALLTSLLLSGCISNPVNDYTRARYYEAGEKAEMAGDLETARRDFGRAQINAQTGNLGPAKEAYACYEWSRVTGYLGRYAEAEKGYIEALALIDKANGQADRLRPPLLCEYARMLRDSGQEPKAVPVYTRALSELEQIYIESVDPMGMAEFLDDYSQALRSAGATGQADAIAARSARIKDKHPGEPAKTQAQQSYANAGHAAQGRNDWGAARLYWSRAVSATEYACLPPAQLAVFYYEYGRSLGAVCEFAEADSYLKKAMKLDQDSGGDYFTDLTELARLNYDQGKFGEAAAFYELDVAALDRKNAEVTAPAAFLDLLREFSDCLKKTGHDEEAKAIDARIAQVAAEHPGLHSITERTPYGKYPPRKI